MAGKLKDRIIELNVPIRYPVWARLTEKAKDDLRSTEFEAAWIIAQYLIEHNHMPPSWIKDSNLNQSEIENQNGDTR